ncbi:hypothetical protein L6303_00805 [archaeon]|nr:hypothetical protein [Nanoarchaeota archaeon]MBU4300918.1 hypothetical protein [Nanoarchaeota archaeon]MBU4451537.1 hypothetical protein [Nanoarchaeota archaeon]MCG2723265.1 hypothetical protein [archaeon]
MTEKIEKFKTSNGFVIIDTDPNSGIKRPWMKMEYENKVGKYQGSENVTYPGIGESMGIHPVGMGDSKVVIDLIHAKVYEGPGLPREILRERDPKKKLAYVEKHYKEAPVVDK